MVDFEKLGAKIDEAEILKREITELGDKQKEKKEEKELLEFQILEILDAINSTTATATTARATVTETEFPTFVDDELLLEWIAQEPMTRMGIFQRRLHAGNWGDLVKMTGEQVPGIGVFPKRKVTISKLPNT
jgi:hypothetical protein